MSGAGNLSRDVVIRLLEGALRSRIHFPQLLGTGRIANAREILIISPAFRTIAPRKIIGVAVDELVDAGKLRTEDLEAFSISVACSVIEPAYELCRFGTLETIRPNHEFV